MNDNSNQYRIPQHNESKAMDSKKDVEASKDHGTDQDFPGYPHHPAGEEILGTGTDLHRTDRKVEKMESASNETGVSQRFGSDAGNNLPSPAGEDYEIQDSNPANAKNEEIGLPQNVSTEDLNKKDRPGTDLIEAARKA